MTHADHMTLHWHLRNYNPNIAGCWVSADRDIELRRQDLFSLYELGNYVKKDGVVTFKYFETQNELELSA